MPALSSYVRIRCISYWMQNICLLLSDIFHVLPAYIQAWKGTDRISTIYNAAVATHYLWKPEIRLQYNEVVETYPVLAIRYYEDQLDGERIKERVNLSKETIKQIKSFIEDNLDEVNGLSDVSE